MDRSGTKSILRHELPPISDFAPLAPLLIDSKTAQESVLRISTWPTCFMRFLPAACFAQSFRLRVMSPP